MRTNSFAASFKFSNGSNILAEVGYPLQSIRYSMSPSLLYLPFMILFISYSGDHSSFWLSTSVLSTGGSGSSTSTSRSKFGVGLSLGKGGSFGMKVFVVAFTSLKFLWSITFKSSTSATDSPCRFCKSVGGGGTMAW